MAMNRLQLLDLINQSGLSNKLSLLKSAFVDNILDKLNPGQSQPITKDQLILQDRELLDGFGPGASEVANLALNFCIGKGHIKGGVQGDFTTNMQLVTNSPMEGYQSFSNVLRQFLLPRYAYLDFDRVVDPRHRIDEECGYPKFITPIMYRYMYDRDDVARRVVDIYPDECWSAELDVREKGARPDDPLTPFEEDWQNLCEYYNLIQYLYRIDKMSGIGHYGVLLMGLDDGMDLEAPVDEPALLVGMRNTVASRPRQLLYLRPFDEYLSFIHQYETDITHPRYGLPKFYNLVFLDMTIDAAGASIGTRLNRRVHWSRVIHVADNLLGSLVFGTPRQQPVFNRLLDLRKIKGGSAEMFWKGAFQGLNFELDPQYVADNPEFDKDAFREEVENYTNGLQRFISTIGIKVNTLAPAFADPEKHIRVQMEAIASHYGVPLRVFMGSEEGKLASTQDKLTWNQRLGRRNRMHVNPHVIRATVDRFIALGIMRPPDSGKYCAAFSDLNTVTDEDKANLALKWTQALSQYVSSGVIHLIPPMDYLTMILGLRPLDAQRIIAEVETKGGFAKLQKVDPSQGSGQNGIAKNNVKPGEKEGQSAGRDEPRDTADKKAEGSVS